MSKRVNGEGSIRKRGDRWVATITLGHDGSGKQIRKEAKFKTHEEASDWLHKMREERNKGRLGLNAKDAGQLTLAAYLDQWLGAKKRHVREKTWLDYRRLAVLHIAPSALGGVKLDKVAPLAIERYLSDLTVSRSPQHVGAVLRILKLSLQQAVDWGMLGWSPASRVKPPKLPRQEMQVWTAEQAGQFLASVQHHRLAPLFHLALATGMRRGELLGLHWKDVDLERGELTVRYSLVQVGAKAVLGAPKTQASYRRVALAADMVAVLRAYRERQAVERAQWGEVEVDERDLVFPSTVGKFQLPSILVRIFHKLIKQADVSRIRFHDLRHTSASLLIAQGVAVKAVSERLGHGDPSLTLKVYTHVYEEQRREAAMPLDVLLAPRLALGKL